jgi:hypothetical protein
VVGRLVPQKRLDILLEAVRDLAARRADVTLDVVGDGSELPFLRQLAIDLGIEAIVSFHGRVDDQTRDALLQTAWLTVNPSMREGWGLSVLEANRLGVPAIAFDVPGLRDAVRDGSTGWLVGPTRTLTETLDAAVATLADEDAAAAYARRARRWAANFSWERTGDRVAGVLAAESSRISVERCNRQATDLVTKVDIDADASVLASVLKEARLDDEWRLENGRLLGLLYGADEDGAETALARLNLTAARIGLAGSTDLLGRADSQQLHAVAEVVSAFRQTVGNPSSPDAVSASRAD